MAHEIWQYVRCTESESFAKLQPILRELSKVGHFTGELYMQYMLYMHVQRTRYICTFFWPLSVYYQLN